MESHLQCITLALKKPRKLEFGVFGPRKSWKTVLKLSEMVVALTEQGCKPRWE